MRQCSEVQWTRKVGCISDNTRRAHGVATITYDLTPLSDILPGVWEEIVDHCGDANDMVLRGDSAAETPGFQTGIIGEPLASA